MGSNTIVGILKYARNKLTYVKDIIVQSNTDLYFLRKNIVSLGYYIADETLVKDMLSDYENEFDSSTAQGRLKSKVKSQILNNIDGLDEESAARYEVFIEELDREINSNPLEIARMIELLLNEGSGTFK